MTRGPRRETAPSVALIDLFIYIYIYECMIDYRLFAYLRYRRGGVDPRAEEGDCILCGDNWKAPQRVLGVKETKKRVVVLRREDVICQRVNPLCVYIYRYIDTDIYIYICIYIYIYI